MATIPAEIFKAYDIRGIVDKTLTPAGVETIGRAIGSEARARAVKSVVIGRDGRIANAMRSLLRVMAARDGRHVELEIVSDAE